MSRDPKHEAPMDAPAKAPLAGARRPFVMTCDRTCMTPRGTLIQIGTQVTLHAAGGARINLIVCMADGSQEEVRGDCFRQWRALEDWRRRILGAPHLRASAYWAEIRTAIEELPDRGPAFTNLPPDIRSLLVVQLSQIVA